MDSEYWPKEHISRKVSKDANLIEGSYCNKRKGRKAAARKSPKID